MPITKAVGDQSTPDPVLFRDYLIFEIRSDAENRPDGPVPIDGIKLCLITVQEIVNEPGLASIDCDRGPAATWVEREVHPCALSRQPAHERWRPNIGRLHALHDRGAQKAGADPLAHSRFAAVAADQKAAGNREPLAVVDVAENGHDTIAVLREIFERGAVEHADAWLGRGVREEYGLEINLIDPVWRLRSRPQSVWPVVCAISLGPRGNTDAAELGPRRRRAGSDIVRIVPGKPGRTQPRGEAEAAEGLHRAGRDRVTLDARRLPRPAKIGDHDIDAAPSQVYCKRQADGTGANNQNLRINCAVHRLLAGQHAPHRAG